MAGTDPGTEARRRVVAVVVTHDRRELLTEALEAVQAQTRPPDAVVVVDNASTDGTAEHVRTRFDLVDLVPLPRNTGGAGGFAAGIAVALHRHRADLLWVMDDDTVPAPGALAALLLAWENSAATPAGRRLRGRPAPAPGGGAAGAVGEPAALVASRVLWTDGREHPMNTPRVRPGASPAEKDVASRLDCVPIRSASFVSVLIDAAAVRRTGLPIADYFLWNDDFEFTTRLLRHRAGLLCRNSVVLHKTRTFGATDADPGRRFFFEVRNKVWMFTRSAGLSPVERLLYAGSTVRRWARTFARSGDRAVLRRELRRGLIAGLGTGPRPTGEILRDLEITCS